MTKTIDIDKSMRLALAAVLVLGLLYLAMRLPASTHVRTRQVQAWPDSTWNIKW